MFDIRLIMTTCGRIMERAEVEEMRRKSPFTQYILLHADIFLILEGWKLRNIAVLLVGRLSVKSSSVMNQFETK
jgi:hypothetical protein